MGYEPVGWTDEDDALVAYEALPDWHPALFVDVFRTCLEQQDSTITHLAGALVTPESLDAWGDFARARAVFESGLKISMTALYGTGAPDVAYVRLVETGQHTNSHLNQVPATMHVTLVWRPEIANFVPGASWRIHHLGEPVEPKHVPRSILGLDPRSQR